MKLLPLFVLAILLPACGNAAYDTTKVKSYKVAILEQPADVQAEFQKLITEFNAFTGFEVLEYAATPDAANSSVTLTPGLREKTGGKVGLGQWLSETKSDSPVTMPGNHPKRQIRYSMRLEFDATYILDNLGHKDRQKIVENQKLFFHEVGHGLEMNHDDSSTHNVMHSNIDGDKDFEPFFTKVRNYMNGD